MASNIKFHENPYSGNRIVPRARTEGYYETVAFRNFANAPKNTTRMVQHSPGVSTRRISWRLSRSSKDITKNLTREWHVFSHTKSQRVQHL